MAVRNGLDPVLKLHLKHAILNLHTTPIGRLVLAQLGAAKFIEAKDQEYTSVAQYAEDVGVDLGNFDYLNY